ncbi:uracil-DNA glycosylase family protein, partial [Desulfobacterales bacterium HSG17]|nr:uracil-DNA glycosylase family protein [Desulfobacterales bacterium HSG17]
AMKLTIDSVFICNAGNLNSVNEKIKTVSPKVIITLGTKAGQALLEIRQPLDKFQGRFHEYHGIKVMPTFHPSLLLKHPEYKRQVWDDMQKVMKLSDVHYES